MYLSDLVHWLVLMLILLVWFLQGHSVTRKLNSDGRVDTMQTLHNMNESIVF